MIKISCFMVKRRWC